MSNQNSTSIAPTHSLSRLGPLHPPLVGTIRATTRAGHTVAIGSYLSGPGLGFTRPERGVCLRNCAKQEAQVCCDVGW